MKVGDLVKDEFGNRGIVLEVALNLNGPSAHVLFYPGSGYVKDQGWILQSLLEIENDFPG